jgi:hypothetical protein
VNVGAADGVSVRVRCTVVSRVVVVLGPAEPDVQAVSASPAATSGTSTVQTLTGASPWPADGHARGLLG